MWGEDTEGGRKMSKWRKKPVIVEAEVYKPGMEDGFVYQLPKCRIEQDGCFDCIRRRPYINTLEGKHYISPGDYIITGVKGERYPCKPDVFHMTYEKIEDEKLQAQLKE